MTIDPMLLSGFAVAIFLAYLGEGVTRMVFGEAGPQPTTGWRETWRRTLWVHPMIGGALIGLFVPGPEVLPPGIAFAVIWYGAAGALALPIYRRLEEKLERKGGAP